MSTQTALLEACISAEKDLAENLIWIRDKVDLEIRQKDLGTLRRLKQIDAAWKTLVHAIVKTEKEGSMSHEAR